jgi:putative transport protein
VVDTLVENPVLVLAAVIGLGAAIGAVRVKGVSLGPAGALASGLAFGAWDERLALPTIMQAFGLAVFAYAVGVASGRTFVSGLRSGGARIAAGVAVLVTVVAVMTEIAGSVVGADTGAISGSFAGVTNNTPALAAAIEQLDGEGSDPVVAYSLTYLSGVVAMIVACRVLLRASPAGAETTTAVADALPTVSWTVEVRRESLPSLGELRTWREGPLAFGRVGHDGTVGVATNATVLEPGDLVTVVGAPDAVESFATWAGIRSDRHLALDRGSLDFRRMVVSQRALAGARISELDLGGRFGAAITRVRRGDLDLVASDGLVLQLGDRVRVIAPAERLAEVARYVGDSDREVSEVDAIGLGIGLALGLACGLVVVPLPGSLEVALGGAGGPLIVGLVLGVVARTGPITWQLPIGSGLMLRQLGTLVFLGVIGTRSGSAFADAITTREGVELALAGVVVATAMAVVGSLVLRRLARGDGIASAGFLAGFQGQPAVLAFATESTRGDERIGAGYAIAFPAGMIVKIIVVQFLARP